MPDAPKFIVLRKVPDAVYPSVGHYYLNESGVLQFRHLQEPRSVKAVYEQDPTLTAVPADELAALRELAAAAATSMQYGEHEVLIAALNTLDQTQAAREQAEANNEHAD